MTLQAGIGIEPLIIIGVMIASAILQAISKRKQDTETWGDLDQPPAAPPVPRRPPPPPIATKSRPEPRPIIRQHTDRRPIPPLPKLPTIPPPLIFEQEGPVREHAHLEQSHKAYEHATNLHELVEKRFAEIDRQTQKHLPSVPKTRQPAQSTSHLLKTFRRPETIRQAFLASFVLSPPKALE